jgi:hypothetical protein
MAAAGSAIWAAAVTRARSAVAVAGAVIGGRLAAAVAGAVVAGAVVGMVVVGGIVVGQAAAVALPARAVVPARPGPAGRFGRAVPGRAGVRAGVGALLGEQAVGDPLLGAHPVQQIEVGLGAELIHPDLGEHRGVFVPGGASADAGVGGQGHPMFVASWT